MAEAPIQVVLNADHYHTERERPQGGGPESDFFEGNDEAFVQHKTSLQGQLQRIATAIEGNPYSRTGFGKVTLRRSRWAKSHRPTRELFTPDQARSVGATDLGEFIVELTPKSARKIGATIAATENITRYRFNPKKQIEQAVPSRARAETSSVESIALWQAADRRRFTLEDAFAWFRDPRNPTAYLVELFERPLPESDWDTLSEDKRAAFRTLQDGLQSQGPGLVAEGRDFSTAGRSWILIRLEWSDAPARVQLAAEPRVVARASPVKADLDPKRHAALLHLLDEHPLVRRIRLQPHVSRTHARGSRAGSPAPLPTPVAGMDYAKVGIVDGGVGSVCDPWVRARWPLLAAVHQDLEHGSFIAGLLVAGRSLNNDPAIGEPDGCELIDLALVPADDDPQAFNNYYPSGASDFLDELEIAVAQLRPQYGVRIFNISLNLHDAQADPDGYSPFAERLDAIADAHDCLFVISAGNLEPPALRAEWPSDAVAALRILAASRDDRVLIPAESIRNVSVNAVNPKGVAGCVDYALANYSRRGPGLRTGVKPDFCHVGGAGQRPPNSTGLYSLDSSGVRIEDSGTSFAAPILARTLASLEQAIEGAVSKETLLALAVHHASRPAPFAAEAVNGLARELIGFGVPAASEVILQGDEHQVTLVFSGRLQQDKQLTFNFTWPNVLTDSKGRCRGSARLTLVSHPPLNYRYGSELVRVNVNARLQQARLNGKYKNQLYETYLPIGDEEALFEAELIEQGFKWSPIKTYARSIPQGIGESSSWRLVVDTLTRANERFPPGGVPFSVVLTIADPRGKQPVFNAMRLALQAQGVQIADVRVAARVVARV